MLTFTIALLFCAILSCQATTRLRRRADSQDTVAALYDTVAIVSKDNSQRALKSKVTAVGACQEETINILLDAQSTEHTAVAHFSSSCSNPDYGNLVKLNMNFALAGDFTSSSNQYAEIYYFLGGKEGQKFEVGACSTPSKAKLEHCANLDTSLDRSVFHNAEDVHVVFARSLFAPSQSDWKAQVQYAKTCCRA